MGAALGAGTDAALVAGHPARAGDAGGAASGAGGSARARTDPGSRGWTAPAQSHRARTTSRQLYLAVGGAGGRDRQVGPHGQPGDPPRAAPAFSVAGPSSGPRQRLMAPTPGAS